LSRAKHLKELVYKEDSEDFKNNQREMYVRMNMQWANGKKDTLQRSLNKGGINEYFVSGEPLTQEEYREYLESNGLDIQHFFVFQGRLEDIGFKGGKQLSSIFEELSGSISLKDTYDSQQAKLRELDDAIVNVTSEMSDLRMERVKMKGLIEYVD